MRYQPIQRLLRLALSLAATQTGLTLDEMASELGVERRTAERLRDALVEVFPQLESYDDDERLRRWRLPAAALITIAEPQPQAIAAVEAVARDHAVRGEHDRAELLKDAALTLRTLLKPKVLRKIEPDVAALMDGEGVAMRPGPRPKIGADIFRSLRRAILGVQIIAIRYARDDEVAASVRLVCPYGILYSGNGQAWLVGQAEGFEDMRLWRLDRITSIDLVDRSYVRKVGFNLADYARQSFGVFQETPVDVVLRFEPSVVQDAAGWLFHPSQTTTSLPDGSLQVSFRAGGFTEMCWHLFTWGDSVTIVAPPELRLLLHSRAEAVAAKHRDGAEQSDVQS